MSTRENWWVVNGHNFLKGVVGNPQNPAILSDDLIVSFLSRLEIARQDFNALLPSLLPEEQERLKNLVRDNPFLNKRLLDPQDYEDARQRKWIRQGVYVQTIHGLKRLKE